MEAQDTSIVIFSEAELMVRTDISVYTVKYGQVDTTKVILQEIVVYF